MMSRQHRMWLHRRMLTHPTPHQACTTPASPKGGSLRCVHICRDHGDSPHGNLPVGERKAAPRGCFPVCAFYDAGCGRKKGCGFVERRFVAVLCTAEAALAKEKQPRRAAFRYAPFTTQDAAGKKDADLSRGVSSPYFVRQKRLSARCGRKKGCGFVERRFVAVLCTAEAALGERKATPQGCFSVCAFFTPHYLARYSVAAIRVKITHASARTISSFGR